MPTDATLPAETLHATGAARAELVLLHGWGGDRALWQPLQALLRPWANVTLLELPGASPSLPGSGLAPLLQDIANRAPPQAVYVGWSLGGQLAAEFARAMPQRVTALVTVCSNPCFVARDGWPGMAAERFDDFRRALLNDPDTALRRFAALQAMGAAQPRPLQRALQRRAGPGSGLQQGLQWLAELNTRPALQALRLPQLHLFGRRDALVPQQAAAALVAQLPANAAVRTLDSGSHAAPLEAPAELARTLYQFLDSGALLSPQPAAPAEIAKRDVAESFSRAAASYDSVAALQRRVGERLLQRLPAVTPGRVLDLGCGTGHFKAALQHRFGDAAYLGLDLAQGMVRHARQHHGSDAQWLVGDAEALPLADQSIDLVFSSLAIQWCYHPERLFAELERVMRPGGVAVFSTLGPQTLSELREAWAAVDDYRHVNEFLPAARLQRAAASVPGLQLQLHGERHAMHYRRVPELLRELKALGAHNMNRDRPAGLTSRRSLQRMFEAYEQFREGGLLPAGYDVIFGVLRKT